MSSKSDSEKKVKATARTFHEVCVEDAMQAKDAGKAYIVEVINWDRLEEYLNATSLGGDWKLVHVFTIKDDVRVCRIVMERA